RKGRGALCLPQSDQAREQPRVAAVEREPALREDLREAGAVAGEDEVAGQSEAEPDADGDAVDLCEGRLGNPLEAHDDLADHAHLLDDRLQPPSGEALPGLAAGEIGSR